MIKPKQVKTSSDRCNLFSFFTSLSLSWFLSCYLFITTCLPIAVLMPPHYSLTQRVRKVAVARQHQLAIEAYQVILEFTLKRKFIYFSFIYFCLVVCAFPFIIFNSSIFLCCSLQTLHLPCCCDFLQRRNSFIALTCCKG